MKKKKIIFEYAKSAKILKNLIKVLYVCKSSQQQVVARMYCCYIAVLIQLFSHTLKGRLVGKVGKNRKRETSGFPSLSLFHAGLNPLTSNYLHLQSLRLPTSVSSMFEIFSWTENPTAKRIHLIKSYNLIFISLF